LPVPFVLMCIGIMFVLFYSIQTFGFMGYKTELNLSTILILVLVGALSIVGNLAIFIAARDAPNAGFPAAILGLQGGVLAILALVFLKDKLTVLQIIGLVLGIVAVVLLSVGSTNNRETKKVSKTPPLADISK